MSDNKPPMTLYFRENISNIHMDGSHMDNRFGQAFAPRKRESDVGPYVHMNSSWRRLRDGQTPITQPR